MALTNFEISIFEAVEHDQFFCSLCKDVLCPPVVLTEKGNVCSECQKDSNLSGIENKILNDIINKMNFQCKYSTEGCLCKLEHVELRKHQKICDFKTRSCPITGCEWSGALKSLPLHFEESHSDYMVNGGNSSATVEINLRACLEIRLIKLRSFSFLLRIILNKGKLYYIVCGESLPIREYSLKLFNKKGNCIKMKSSVFSLNDIYSDINGNFEVVDENVLKFASEDMNYVIVTFKIKVNATKDEIMWNSLECPVCKDYMQAPIHQCHNGHSVCHVCKPKLSCCPTCRAGFGSMRNYALENLISRVPQPCIYQDSGCLKKLIHPELTQHQNNCPFKPYKCPFASCTLSGNKNLMINHLQTHHRNMLVLGETRDDYIRLDQHAFYSSQSMERMCMIAFDQIFRISIRRVDEYSYWAVEVIGPGTENNFLYEVAIRDHNKPKKQIIRIDYCLSEHSNDELFKKCIIFPNSILSSYSCNAVVYYKIRVLRNK